MEIGMSHSYRRPVALGRLAAASLSLLALVGCAGPSATPPVSGSVAVSPPVAASSAPSPHGSGPPTSGAGTPLTVGLGYVPSVQFAPFYLAQQDGSYAAAGLDVTFQNKIDLDLIPLIGQGAIDVGLGDGTSIIPAVAQGIPVRYVATVYAKFPNAVIARKEAGITKPADLAGKTLGTPGQYGSSWIMLEALLHSAGLSPSDLDIRLYPDFGQAGALAAGAVTSITGFINNEPITLAGEGIATDLLTVDAITPLPGPGLVTGTSTLANKRPALVAFIAATLKAMQEVAADPQKGLDATFAVAPDLSSNPEGQLAILKATIPLWTNDYVAAHGTGAIDPAAWSASVAFMTSLGNSGVTTAPPLDQLIDSELLPAQ